MRLSFKVLIACFVSIGQYADDPIPQVAEQLQVVTQLKEIESEILAAEKRLSANRAKKSKSWKTLIAKDEARLKTFRRQREEANIKLEELSAAIKAERKRREGLPPRPKKPDEEHSRNVVPGQPIDEGDFSMLRKDGSFRQGDDFFRIGEAFRLHPFGSKAQADKNRRMLAQGHDPKYVKDLDNISIVQVLDGDSILASFNSGRSPVFILRGIDTAEIRENNLSTYWVSGRFKVSGTHRYETRRGTINTVFLLESMSNR